MKIKEIWKKASGFVYDHRDDLMTGASYGIIIGFSSGLLLRAGFKFGEICNAGYTYELMSSDTINNPDLTLKDFMKNHGMID